MVGYLLEGQASPSVLRVRDCGPVRVSVVALEAEDRLPKACGSVGICALEDDAEQPSDGFVHGAFLPFASEGAAHLLRRLEPVAPRPSLV